jgi:protocatechuate 3,4-dioxygenase beta subunit
VGLFTSLRNKLGKRLRRTSSLPRRTAANSRICRFEPLETRQYLSAVPPIYLGAVYHEDGMQSGQAADTMMISFVGGVAGTQLNTITIDVGKSSSGIFFHTSSTGAGDNTYPAYPVTIVDQGNVGSVSFQQPADGSTVLTLQCTNFVAGDVLTISFGLNQMVTMAGSSPIDNPTVNGVEFSGTLLTGQFTAPNYYAATGSDTYVNQYDYKMVGTGLNLPPADYMPPATTSQVLQTAGAMANLVQAPLPSSLSGEVLVDSDGTHTEDAANQPLPGITVDLLDSQGNVLATTTTGSNGQYTFTNLTPGQYGVEDVQPSAYLAEVSEAGSVGGTSLSANEINTVVLGPNVNGVHYDFYNLIPASISGKVLVDSDGTHTEDAANQPLSGITVNLLNPQGQVLATTTTGQNGQYSFTGLTPGQYAVDDVQPTGYFAEVSEPGNVGGTALSANEINAVVLGQGVNGVHYDFYNVVPASIAGKVLVDNDATHSEDANNPAITGVTVNLLNSQGAVLATTTTDKNGNYSFTGLMPGQYAVDDVQPAGYFAEVSEPGSVGGTSLSANEITTVVLGSGASGVHYDFYNVAPASIAGKVLVDSDGTHSEDTANPAIAGVTVSLLNSQGAVVATTTTDKNGQYSFTGLMPGQYAVDDAQPANYFAEVSEPGSVGGKTPSANAITTIVLGSGVNGLHYDFYNLAPVSINGKVLVDSDGTHSEDTANAPITGVTVNLLDAQGNVLASTTTDKNGQYSFTGLMPGQYAVDDVQPAGYFAEVSEPGSVGGNALSANEITTVVLASGINGLHYDFYNLAPASIAGKVQVDNDGTGAEDAANTAIAGVTVQLYNSQAQLVGTTTTNQNGQYSFTGLLPGQYAVDDVQPAGYFAENSKIGSVGGMVISANMISTVVLPSGTNGVHYDFNNLAPASVSGMVMVDNDGSGAEDAANPGVAGVTVNLLNSAGKVVATTTTDQNGQYSFTGLTPGQYLVADVQPAGYFAEDSEVGSVGGNSDSANQISAIVLGSGVQGLHYDFCELLPVTISGQVYSDPNQNEQLDSGEPLLSGVTVQLLDQNGNQLAQTTTNDQGFYQFTDLVPGTYGVQDVQPSGYFAEAAVAGSQGGAVASVNLMNQIVLGSGVNATNYDFCEVAPATLSGYVFQDGPTIQLQQGQSLPPIDTIRTGQITASDPRLASVQLELGNAVGEPILDSNGQPITTTTDQNGYYQFTNLAPGTYTVIEFKPAGYLAGIDTAGSNGGVVVNKNSTVSPLFLETLSTTVQNNDAIVKIPITPGAQAVSYNFSTVLVQTKPASGGFSPLPPDGFIPPPVATGAPVELLRTEYYSVPQPVTPAVFMGGGSNTDASDTWHLSVVDGGQPRSDDLPSGVADTANSGTFSDAAWAGIDMNQGTWIVANTKGVVIKKMVFGLHSGLPVAGDWNGDGKAKVGIFINGEWFMDFNGDGVWNEGDLWAQLGHAGDRPVTGDWDGDGKTDIGVFGPAWSGDDRALAREPGQPHPQNASTGRYKNLPPTAAEATDGYRALRKTARGKLRTDLIDHVFHFGVHGDIPVTGDWNGSGVHTVGVFRDGTWYLDIDGDGKFGPGDMVFQFGEAGDIPLVGDWVGDGITRVGVYHQGKVYLDTNNNHRLDPEDKVFELGRPGDTPVVGDFDGDGVDDIAVYHDGVDAAPAQAALPAATPAAGVQR